MINFQDEHHHQKMGFYYKDLRQFDKALEEFKQALKINPDTKCAAECIASCVEAIKQKEQG